MLPGLTVWLSTRLLVGMCVVLGPTALKTRENVCVCGGRRGSEYAESISVGFYQNIVLYNLFSSKVCRINGHQR